MSERDNQIRRIAYLPTVMVRGWAASAAFVVGSFAACSSHQSAASAPDAAADAASCRSASPPFGAQPAAGDSFPDIEIASCAGDRTTLGTVRCAAAVTLVSIAAGWCGPCRKETTSLQAIRDEFAPQGVAVVQILYQDDKANPATSLFCQQWTQQYGLALPVYIDPPGNAVASFGNSAAFPLNLIVDRDGHVLWSAQGSVPDLRAVLKSFLPDGG